MSLDIYLEGKKKKVLCYACGKSHKEREDLFHINITHNLNSMAERAGIYKALWRPEEIDAIYAKDIIEIVEKGLADLKASPKYFEQFNSSNGWGMYEHFIPFVSEYLDALKENPNARIRVSR